MVPLMISTIAFFAWCFFSREKGWPDWANYRAKDKLGVRYFQNEPDLVDGYWIDFMDGMASARGKKEDGDDIWIEARPKDLK